jgi:hypothetical protein
MKYKAVMIAQCIVAYLMQLPFLGLIIALFINDEISQNIIIGFEVYSIAMCVVCLLIAFLNVTITILNVTKDVPCPYKLTMAVKLAMIPFYVINFLIWAIFVIGTLNPFFIVLLPIIIAFSIISTYFVMLSTSSQNIAYLLRQFFLQKNLVFLVYAIFHFIFCVDVIVAILLNCNYKPTTNYNGTDI